MDLAQDIGFTEGKVQALCEKFGVDFDRMKEWYNGYNLNSIAMYNPLSVVRAHSTSKSKGSDVNMDISVIGKADGPTSIFLAGTLSDLFYAQGRIRKIVAVATCAPRVSRGEEHSPTRFIPAFAILILFYGIYFAKKITQKRRGIQTTQLGRGKERSVRTIEIIMSAATLLIVPVELISIVLDWNIMPSSIRVAGIVVGLIGDLVFLTAVLTMKDSWRAGIPETDKTEFVSHGIYQYSRNPAFLGFDMMYTGILVMYFNWLLFLFTVWVVVMLHLQILQEEKYLETVFGEEYLAYKRHTGRYCGRKR